MSSLHLAGFLAVRPAPFCGLLALCLGTCERNGEMDRGLLFHPILALHRDGALHPKPIAVLPLHSLPCHGVWAPVRGCPLAWGVRQFQFPQGKMEITAHEGDSALTGAISAPGLPPYCHAMGPHSRINAQRGWRGFSKGRALGCWAKNVGMGTALWQVACAVRTPNHSLRLGMVRLVPLNENNLCYGTSKININKICSYWGVSDRHGLSNAAAEASFILLQGQASSFYPSH